MKKAALTIGLLSTVLVATSFAAPANSSNNIPQIGNELYDDGGSVGTGTQQGRKLDFQANNNEAQNLNQSEGFRQDRQSLGRTQKLD